MPKNKPSRPKQGTQQPSTDYAELSKKKQKRPEKRREKGMGSITKRRKRFYIRFKVGDKLKYSMLRNSDGTPCVTKDDAQKAADKYRMLLLAETKQEIATFVADAKRLKRQSGLSLSYAWETFLKQPTRNECAESTEKKYEGQFKIFIGWIAKEHPEIELVAQVDHDIALDFMQWLWGTGISAITFNKYTMALHLIFKHLKDAAGLEDNPFDNIPHKPNEVVSRKEFSPEQVKAIFSGFQTGFFYESEVERLTSGRERERVKVQKEYVPLFKDEMRVLLYLCCYTGCRGQDGCLMSWKNIDLSRGIISFIPRKTAQRTGGRLVTLPIAPDLLNALHDALTWRGDNKPTEDFILPKVAGRYNRNPSGIAKDVMRIIQCATGLETTVDKSELYGRRKIAANAYGLHSFRHTFVSFCANAGVPYSVVASIVGHGNPAMTEHYSHISTETKRDAVRAIPSFLPAQANGEEDIIDEPLSVRRRAIVEALQTADSNILSRIESILKIHR